MVAFTDSQLRTVRAAAYSVPAEKRRVFIERVVARLQLHRGFTDADLGACSIDRANTIDGLMAHRRFPPPAKARLLSLSHVDTLYVPATQSRSY
jgi:hypothetical protein